MSFNVSMFGNPKELFISNAVNKRWHALVYVPQMRHLSEQVKYDQSCFQNAISVFDFTLYMFSFFFGCSSMYFRGFNRPKKKCQGFTTGQESPIV